MCNVLSNGDQGFYFVENLLADPFDLHEIFYRFERVILTEGNHPFGQSGADPWQGCQLLFGGSIDIDFVGTKSRADTDTKKGKNEKECDNPTL